MPAQQYVFLFTGRNPLFFPHNDVDHLPDPAVMQERFIPAVEPVAGFGYKRKLVEGFNDIEVKQAGMIVS